MSLRVVQHHLHTAGMPATSRGSRARQRAIACHDTEGAAGEQGAWNTISWMHATAAQRNASYNEFWAFNEQTGELLVIVVVPPSHAAHSVAPQPTGSTGLPLYQPDTAVRSALGDKVGDPNMWVYAVSIAGRVADVDRYARNPQFVQAARQRLEQLNYGPWLEHFRFNPRTRSDWGRALMPALTAAPAEVDMYDWAARIKPAAYRAVVEPNSALRDGPTLKHDLLWLTKEPTPIEVVGEVEGDPHPTSGNKTYCVYLSSHQPALRCTNKTNVAVLPPAPPSGGIALDSWTALQKQGESDLRNVATVATKAADALAAKKP